MSTCSSHISSRKTISENFFVFHESILFHENQAQSEAFFQSDYFMTYLKVVLLLKRVLPEVSPKTLALITDVRSLPPADFHVLAGSVNSSFDINK